MAIQQRIAVVGTGISGNLAARILSTKHEVDVFEAASHIGGHAHTVDVHAYGRDISADVAFMVLNRRTYPNFCRMLEALDVPIQDSDMSLSVRCFQTGLEYQGSSLNGLFAQRKNLIRPSFYRMLADILRFNRAATEFCETQQQTPGTDAETILLGDFLHHLRLGESFYDQYLVPMSAAIWSADPRSLVEFPAKFILGFFRNHGLLQLRDRPQWKTITDRSRRYVERLVGPIRDRVFLDTCVRSVRRIRHGVQIQLEDGTSRNYDHVVMATHADQTLSMIKDADALERQILDCFPYQANEAVLHTDESILPRRRRAWASWNYHIPKQVHPTTSQAAGQASDQTASGDRSCEPERVSVTYDLNRLQTLGLPGPLCLTLNPNQKLDAAKVLARFEFQHPHFSLRSVRAQQRFSEINGRRCVSFCGAYWGYGFHEDGVNSALAVTQPFGLTLDALRESPIPSTMDSIPIDRSGEVSVA